MVQYEILEIYEDPSGKTYPKEVSWTIVEGMPEDIHWTFIPFERRRN